MSDNGLVTVASNHSVKDTIYRAAANLAAKGIAVFARVDHAAGAASVGMALRPTEVLIFGSPKAGTPLMQSQQSIGIDLPLKLLAWQDEAGQVWLAYNDMHWLARRHQLGGHSASAVSGLASVLDGLAKATAA